MQPGRQHLNNLFNHSANLGTPPSGIYNLAVYPDPSLTLPAGRYKDVTIILGPHQTLHITPGVELTGNSTVVTNGGRIVFGSPVLALDKEPGTIMTESPMPSGALRQDIISINEKIHVTLPRALEIYPGLKLVEVNGTTEALDVSEVPDSLRPALRADIDYALKNPWIPQENVYNNFITYQAFDPSQELALETARRFVEEGNSTKNQMLVLWGDPGLGKTHLVIAACKALADYNLPVHFVTRENAYEMKMGFRPSSVTGPSIWLFDDVNDQYQHNMSLLKDVALSVFDNGGRILITSNRNFPVFFEQTVREDSLRQDKERILDRFMTMSSFTVELKGTSYRRTASRSPD